jgi:hypothetical protein
VVLDFPGSGLSGDVSTGHPCYSGSTGLADLSSGYTWLIGPTGLTAAPGSHLTVSTGVGGGGEPPVVSAGAAVHVSCGPVSSLSGLQPLSRPGEQVSGSL